MYAAHSAESWGAGNFSDWKKLGNWLASKGGRVMATLPILSVFLGSPIVEPSPYSPASRLFWNEFMIDISAIPEFKTSSAAKKVISSSSFRKSLNQLRSSTLVDYSEAWAGRRKVLEVLAREFFNSSRRPDLEDYLKKNPETKDYAAFRAACDHLKTSWQGWPAAAKNGKLDARVSPKDLQQFYLYIQWIAQLQMDDLLASFRSDEIRFYLDLPLGVNPDSYDAWRYREFFADGASAWRPGEPYSGSKPTHPRHAARLDFCEEDITGGIAENAVGAVKRRPAAAKARPVGRESGETRDHVADVDDAQLRVLIDVHRPR